MKRRIAALVAASIIGGPTAAYAQEVGTSSLHCERNDFGALTCTQYSDDEVRTQIIDMWHGETVHVEWTVGQAVCEVFEDQSGFCFAYDGDVRTSGIGQDYAGTAVLQHTAGIVTHVYELTEDDPQLQYRLLMWHRR